LGPRAAFLVNNVGGVTMLTLCFLRFLPEKRVPRGQRKFDVAFLRNHAALALLSVLMSVLALLAAFSQTLLGDVHKRSIFALSCALVVPLLIYLLLRPTSPTLAKAAVWMFLRGCFQPIYGDTMFQWLKNHPEGPQLSVVVISWTEFMGGIGLFLGTTFYNKYMTQLSYRFIFSVALFMTAGTSMLDLILVKRWNLAMGIPDLFFALGENAVMVCMGRLLHVPLCVMASKLCPRSVEGTMFSLLMGIGNFGFSMGLIFGTFLLESLGVVGGNYERLSDAIILKGLVALIPVLLVPFLVPRATPQDPIAEGDAKGAQEIGNRDGVSKDEVNENEGKTSVCKDSAKAEVDGANAFPGLRSASTILPTEDSKDDISNDSMPNCSDSDSV